MVQAWKMTFVGEEILANLNFFKFFFAYSKAILKTLE
jgi:hypothetical protein